MMMVIKFAFILLQKAAQDEKRKFNNKEEREHLKKIIINGSSVARAQTQKNTIYWKQDNVKRRNHSA